LSQYWKLRRTINGNVDYCPFSSTYYSYSAVLYDEDEEEELGFKPQLIRKPKMKNEVVRAESILLIDDDSAVLQLQKTILEEAGYKVILAADGVYGMELCGEEKPDLVLLDILMPGPDGFQVLESIRKRSNVPVIMVSGIRQVDTIPKALSLGADDFLMKPFKPSELVARVAAKLRRTK